MRGLVPHIQAGYSIDTHRQSGGLRPFLRLARMVRGVPAVGAGGCGSGVGGQGVPLRRRGVLRKASLPIGRLAAVHRIPLALHLACRVYRPRRVHPIPRPQLTAHAIIPPRMTLDVGAIAIGILIANTPVVGFSVSKMIEGHRMPELMSEAVAAHIEPHGRPASPACCPRRIVDVLVAAVVFAEPSLPNGSAVRVGRVLPTKGCVAKAEAMVRHRKAKRELVLQDAPVVAGVTLIESARDFGEAALRCDELGALGRRDDDRVEH
eukprot:scaffold65539_cov56-Phaeocystis_antarctica.AAC.2